MNKIKTIILTIILISVTALAFADNIQVRLEVEGVGQSTTDTIVYCIDKALRKKEMVLSSNLTTAEDICFTLYILHSTVGETVTYATVIVLNVPEKVDVFNNREIYFGSSLGSTYKKDLQKVCKEIVDTIDDDYFSVVREAIKEEK